MMTIEQIQSEIKSLPYSEYIRLLDWMELMSEDKENSDNATEELLRIEGFEASVKAAQQRVQAGQFRRFGDIKRNV